MATKRERLARLLKAQQQLKNLQEQKRAQLQAEVARLEQITEEVGKTLDEGGYVTSLFSDLSYQFLFRVAADRRAAEEAGREVSLQAQVERKRLERLPQRFADFSRADERERTERDNLENVDKATAAKSSFRQA